MVNGVANVPICLSQRVDMQDTRWAVRINNLSAGPSSILVENPIWRTWRLLRFARTQLPYLRVLRCRVIIQRTRFFDQAV